jgi:tripartite-type tricarboxylate transporter receptor subunit TctC
MAVRPRDTFKAVLETASIRALMAKYDIVPAYRDGAGFKARITEIAASMKPIIAQLGLAKEE